MTPDQYDLVIVGTGTAGMAAAEFAATLELRVAAVEHGRVGGTRVWSGGVPSNALRAAGRVARTVATAGSFGIDVPGATVDLDRVWARVRAIRDEIATADDDVARLGVLGVELLRGRAVLTGPNEVTVLHPDATDVEAGDAGSAEAGSTILQTRFVLLCTGSTPTVPAIDGLDGSTGATGSPPVYTSETFFDIEHPPSSIVVIGGGHTGVELAQACARLGVRVTLVEREDGLLAGEEPSLVALLTDVLRDDGVEVVLGTEAIAVRHDTDPPADRPGEPVVVTTRPAGTAAGTTGHRSEWRAGAVLLATGRRPDVSSLGLDELGVEVRPEGVVVDERSRTVFRSVYAVGDVASGGRHPGAATNAAALGAVHAVRDMFFPGRVTMPTLVPWCTFTDPELAHVGLTSDEAEARHGDDVDVWRLDLAHSDRARVEGSAVGALVVVTAKDRIVGAHLLAPSAGEVVHELAVAVDHGLKLADLADVVHVHPTISGIVGRLAAESVQERAQRYRWLVRRR